MWSLREVRGTGLSANNCAMVSDEDFRFNIWISFGLKDKPRKLYDSEDIGQQLDHCFRIFMDKARYCVEYVGHSGLISLGWLITKTVDNKRDIFSSLSDPETGKTGDSFHLHVAIKPWGLSEWKSHDGRHSNTIKCVWCWEQRRQRNLMQQRDPSPLRWDGEEIFEGIKVSRNQSCYHLPPLWWFNNIT